MLDQMPEQAGMRYFIFCLNFGPEDWTASMNTALGYQKEVRWWVVSACPKFPAPTSFRCLWHFVNWPLVAARWGGGKPWNSWRAAANPKLIHVMRDEVTVSSDHSSRLYKSAPCDQYGASHRHQPPLSSVRMFCLNKQGPKKKKKKKSSHTNGVEATACGVCGFY